jgi:hypothetical protein
VYLVHGFMCSLVHREEEELRERSPTRIAG